MSEELTKLTEEMYDSLTKFVNFVSRYRLEGDRHAEHEMKMATAWNLVAYIGEAYADRLALPDELGRVIGFDELSKLHFKIWLNAPDDVAFNLEGYRFIVLPPKKEN